MPYEVETKGGKEVATPPASQIAPNSSDNSRDRRRVTFASKSTVQDAPPGWLNENTPGERMSEGDHGVSSEGSRTTAQASSNPLNDPGRSCRETRPNLSLLDPEDEGRWT